MGHAESKEDTGDREAKKDKVFDYKKIYYDHDGNLRYGEERFRVISQNAFLKTVCHHWYDVWIGESARDRDAELLKLLALDDYDESDPNRIW